MPTKNNTVKSVVDSLVPEYTVDYQKFFESLPHGFIAVLPDDPDFTIVAQNNTHAEYAMVKLGESLGKPLFEVFPDSSHKYLTTGVNDVAESLRRVIKSKKPDTMPTLRYDLKNPDGELTTEYWQLTHYPLFADSGKLIMLYQATEDITESIVAGSNLKRIQEQLNEALSVGMIGTWLWDIAGNKITGDKNMATMFGVPEDMAANGLPLDSFTSRIHPEDRSRVKKEIAEAVKSSDTFYSEYRTLAKNGTVRWLIARGRIERGPDGKASSFPGVLVDITDRKLVENNLSYLAKASVILSSSLDFKKTLKNIAKLMVPDIADWCTVQIIDDYGILQQVAVAHKDPAMVKRAIELRKLQGQQDLDEPNGVAQVIRTGEPEFYPVIRDEILVAAVKNPEELKLLRDLGLNSAITVPLKINNKTVGAISLILSGQKRSYNETDLEMASELANRASLAMTNSSLFNEAQKELNERTRLEKALLAANEELEDRVEARTNELEESNLNLQRSNQELQDFAYVASHDLQEPLRKIQAFGNLLETEFSAELGEGKDYLARMRNAAARMSALIEDILSFSRVTSTGREFVNVNLKTIATEVVNDLEVRIGDTGAKVEIGQLPIIQADAMQMRQLLQNLIANAIKFHREGVPPIIKISSVMEVVEIDKHARLKYCRLEIKDNGLGFDEKYLDRIFAVFQRLHNRESYEGTGIGLAVCRKIVERHSGTITATSKLGSGSTFIISLPIRHKKGEELS